MIMMETFLDVADNTGAKEVMCIRVLGASKQRYARIGDIIVCSVVPPMTKVVGAVTRSLSFAGPVVTRVFNVPPLLKSAPLISFCSHRCVRFLFACQSSESRFVPNCPPQGNCVVVKHLKFG